MVHRSWLAPLWFGTMVTALVTGVFAFIASESFREAGHPHSAYFWSRNGWIGIGIGIVGIVFGLIVLMFTTPSATPEASKASGWWLVRMWRVLRRIRIVLKPLKESAKEPEMIGGVARLFDIAKSEIETQGRVIAIREKERDEARDLHQKEMQAAEQFRQERDRIEQARSTAEARLAISEREVAGLSKTLDGRKTKLDWADSLIERERAWPLFNLPMMVCFLAGEPHLDDPEPYFNIDLGIEYKGVLRLIVGETCLGKFSWHGLEFADPPQVTQGGAMSWEALPFSHVGPTFAQIRFKQYVHGRSDEIKEHLKSQAGMEFGTAGMTLSLRCEVPFSGEVLLDRNIFGGELPAPRRAR